MPLSPAERQRRWRQRKSGDLPPPVVGQCQACGGQHRGSHGDLCSRCWWATEGRKLRAKQKREQRQRQRAQSSPSAET